MIIGRRVFGDVVSPVSRAVRGFDGLGKQHDEHVLTWRTHCWLDRLWADLGLRPSAQTILSPDRIDPVDISTPCDAALRRK